MLAKKRRVKTKEFNFVFSSIESKNYTSPFFSIKVVSDKEISQKTTFSCVVSKKIANTAVLRNKTRRRVYEIIKKILPIVKNGYICLVFVKKEAINTDFSTLKENFNQLIKKAGVI